MDPTLSGWRLYYSYSEQYVRIDSLFARFDGQAYRVLTGRGIKREPVQRLQRNRIAKCRPELTEDRRLRPVGRRHYVGSLYWYGARNGVQNLRCSDEPRREIEVNTLRRGTASCGQGIVTVGDKHLRAMSGPGNRCEDVRVKQS